MGSLVYLEGWYAEGVKLEAAFRQKSVDVTPEERIDANNAHMSDRSTLGQPLVARRHALTRNHRVIAGFLK